MTFMGRAIKLNHHFRAVYYLGLDNSPLEKIIWDNWTKDKIKEYEQLYFVLSEQSFSPSVLEDLRLLSRLKKKQ